jgi:hypothetical protein
MAAFGDKAQPLARIYLQAAVYIRNSLSVIYKRARKGCGFSARDVRIYSAGLTHKSSKRTKIKLSVQNSPEDFFLCRLFL